MKGYYRLRNTNNSRFYKSRKETKELEESQNRKLGEVDKRLLQEQEKRIKLEEEMKNWRMINSWLERDKDKYSKEANELKNNFWQLRFILSWYGFEQKEINKIVDGSISVPKWEEISEIKRIKEEIIEKRFNCKCDKK